MKLEHFLGVPVVVDNPLAAVPPVVLHRGCSLVEGVGNLARHLLDQSGYDHTTIGVLF